MKGDVIEDKLTMEGQHDVLLTKFTSRNLRLVCVDAKVAVLDFRA